MKVIKERSKVYGDFKDIAEISQDLKSVLFDCYANSEPVVREGLDMIIHKLARVCGSDKGYKYIDNWRDISAYAQLIVNYLENQSEEALDSVVMYKEKTNGTWSELRSNK